MAKVRALTKGYIGSVIREMGEVFDWPEGVKVGKWVEPVAFKGKGDHDSDGLTGGSKSDEGGDKKLSDMTVAELRVVADERGVDLTGISKKADIVKSLEGGDTVKAPTAEPFADPPAPIRVENEVNTATGGTEPDWISPPGVETPVPADD